MATASIEVGYRPVRVGMLVREGEIADVVAAAQLNTLVWGGLFNPIIPVGEDSASAVQLAQHFHVDVLHRVVADDRLDTVVEALPHLRLRSFFGEDLFAPMIDDELGLVDIRLPINHYFQTIVQHGGGGGRAALPSWPDGHELAALYTVVFGSYPSDRPGPRYRAAFERGLAANTSYRLEDGLNVPVSLLKVVKPITLTADSLWGRRHWPSEDGIFVGDPASAEDLTAFWNLRATGRTVEFWALPDGATIAAYVREHLRSLTPRTTRDQESVGPHFWRRGSWPRPPAASLPVGLADAVAETGVSPVLAQVNGASWDDAPHATQSRSVLATIEERSWGGLQMIFALPENPYSNARTESFREMWFVTISELSEYEHPGYTIRLPALSDLNDWASDALQVTVADVRLGPGPVAVLTRQSETNVKVSLVEEAEVVRQVFGRAGLQLSRSPAGEATARIVSQMGGLSDCRVFRLPGVRAVLARSTRAFTRQQLVSEIIDRNSIRRYGNLHDGGEEILQRLLDRGVFHAGLHVQCPACKVRSRFVPESLAPDLRCPRCGTLFPLAPNLAEAKWKFEASGFFAHHREHGAIPTILGMLRLENDFALDHLLLIESHVISDGNELRCESDFVGLLPMRDDERLVAVVAECKGGREEITRQDVEHLAQVSALVTASGISCYVVLATTRTAFTEAELTILREFEAGALSGRMILLTWFDLRSYEHYGAGLDALVPREYVRSMRVLAGNSKALYLDDPPGIARYSDNAAEGLLI